MALTHSVPVLGRVASYPPPPHIPNTALPRGLGCRAPSIPSITRRTTRLPPGEPRMCFTKDPTDTTLWRAAEPPPHHLQTVFMYVCKIQPSPGGQHCLGAWCPCPCRSLAALMLGSCPPTPAPCPHTSSGPNPAPRTGARCPLVFMGHQQHQGPGF